MPTISWDETLPSDSENAGLGDDRIRSLKSSVRVGLDSEHVWPSGGGDAGVHRLGSGRPFYGPQSLVSSSGTDGRLMVTSDTSRLFHVGSAGTMFLGGERILSVGSSPVGGQRFYWAIEFGRGVTLSGYTVIPIPNSGYSGIPFITATMQMGSEAPYVGGSFAVIGLDFFLASKTNFEVFSFLPNGAPTTIDTVFNWISIGTRTF